MSDEQKTTEDKVPEYPEPVDKLLHLGEATSDITDFDYLKMGINQAHRADLLRMIRDEDLHNAPDDSDLVWAPVHAWRALTQQADPSVAGDIIDALFWRIDAEDDTWAFQDMPLIMALLGPKTLPALNASLDPEKPHGISSRFVAITCMLVIADIYEDMERIVFALLIKQLDDYERHHIAINTFLISALADTPWADSIEGKIKKVILSGRVDFEILEELDAVELINSEGEVINAEEIMRPSKKTTRKKKRNKKKKS